MPKPPTPGPAGRNDPGTRLPALSAFSFSSCLRAGWGTSRVWTASSGGGTHVRHAEVNDGAPGSEVAHGCKFLPGAQGGLDRGDLTEPALVFGLLEPVAEVCVNLFQPWYLSWVNPKERAPDAPFSCAQGVP
jgi:hypothetical protein